MTIHFAHGRRLGALALLAVLGLTISACMLSPGKFAAELTVRKDGHFRFTYNGEVHVLALSRFADMMNSGSSDEKFTAQPCYKESATGTSEERTCSERELADQLRTWESSRDSANLRKRREADSMKAMFGGIDPADPKAAEEFATRLRRQAGWNKVVHRGEGLFDVEFATEGQLTHDFAFPTIERFPGASPFLQVMRRGDGSVRIDAPGFAPAAAGEPYRGLMQAAALSEGKTRMPKLPEMDGTFTVRTDAAILANNTELGPQDDRAGQRLEWRVNQRSAAAPTVLLRLGR